MHVVIVTFSRSCRQRRGSKQQAPARTKSEGSLLLTARTGKQKGVRARRVPPPAPWTKSPCDVSSRRRSRMRTTPAPRRCETSSAWSTGRQVSGPGGEHPVLHGVQERRPRGDAPGLPGPRATTSTWCTRGCSNCGLWHIVIEIVSTLGFES